MINCQFCHFRQIRHFCQNCHFPKGPFAISFEFLFTVWRFWQLGAISAIFANACISGHISPFDPRSFLVIGVKGSMITVKRGGEIKSQNSSHCKLLKHAREDWSKKVWIHPLRKELKQAPGKICVCFLTTSAQPVWWQLMVDVTSLMVHQHLRSDGNGATSTAGRQYCSKRAKKISANKNVYLEHYLQGLWATLEKRGEM